MRRSVDVRDDECPACDSSLPGEFDEVLNVFTCPCCSCTWKPRPRRVPPDVLDRGERATRRRPRG